MKSHMNLAQRTLAIFAAAGTTALMTLPAFAQVNSQADSTQPNVVQGVIDNNTNSNSGMMNNQTSDNCVSYVNGGVGGPVESDTSINAQVAPSSYDVARTGIDNGSMTLNSDLSVNNRTSSSMGTSTNSTASNNTGNLDSSYAAARTGIPNAVGATTDQTMMGSTTNQTMMGSTTTYNNSGVQPARAHRQFDGNNRSAAIPYRDNAYGTAGHEVKMNLDARQESQNSYPTAYNSNSYQASTTLPVACGSR